MKRTLVVCILIFSTLLLGQVPLFAQEPVGQLPLSFANNPLDIPQPHEAIPRHEPGYLAIHRANAVQPLSAQDEGILDDPFKGNRTFVKLDNPIVGGVQQDTDGQLYFRHDTSAGNQDSDGDGDFDLVPPTLISESEAKMGPIPNSTKPFDMASEDLNGDNWSEQAGVWINGNDGHLYLTLGQRPGANGKILTGPAVTVRGGDIDLFVGDLVDDLLYRRGSTSGTFQILGESVTTGMAAISQNANHIQLFTVVGNEVKSISGNGSSWNTPISLSAPSVPLYPTAPGAVAYGGNKVMVFARATDNTLWQREFDGANWGGWQSLGGTVTSSPAAVTTGGNNLIVFARWVDGTLWHRTYGNGNWQPWQPLGTPNGLTVKGAPAATTVQGQVNLFVLVEDGDGNSSLWQAQYQNTPNLQWEQIEAINAQEIAAAGRSDGTIDLYARTPRGMLFYWHYSGSSWSQGTQQVRLTARIKQSKTDIVPDVDLPVVIETGYFLGNGRNQVVVANGQTGRVQLHLYDAANFKPQLLDRLTDQDLLADDRQFAVTTGDFLPDVEGSFGFDEIALAITRDNDFLVRIYDVDGQGKLSVYGEHIIDISYLESVYGKPSEFPCGSLELREINGRYVTLASGNITGQYPESLIFGYSALLTFRDNSCERNRNASFVTPIFVAESLTKGANSLVVGSANPYVGVAVGDVTGITGENAARQDEVVVAFPNGQLKVYELDPSLSLIEKAARSFSTPNLPLAVEVGDFNRDVKDEIALLTWLENPSRKSLSTYVYNNNQLSPIGQRTFDSVPGENKQIVLATGDLVARSVRVGPPTHRVERDSGNIVAIINRPPTHVGISNATDYLRTFASFETKESVQTEIAVKESRKWGSSLTISKQFEGGVNLSLVKLNSKVQQSVTGSYGQGFENTTKEIQAVTFGQETKANRDDALIYTLTDYDIWEYPVYIDNSGIPVNFMVVVFPKEKNGIFTNKRTLAGQDCASWYRPRHQFNNVWSYSKIGDTSQLIGYDGGRPLAEGDYGISGIENSFVYESKNGTVESKSSTVETKIRQEIEYENRVALSLGLVNFSTNLGIKASGQYETSDTSTLTISANDSTTVRANFGSITEDGASYEVHPYLYWTDEGYLMLDYTTSLRDDQSFWQQYNRSDPAFILPWAGKSGCVPNNSSLSPDLEVVPSYANVGETVTVSATLRNYSDIDANNVEVKFYLGDPDNGGTQIGQAQTIPALSRNTGSATVSIDWVVTGSGQQKIYAKIDPNNTLSEMREDNNKAYTLMQVGAVTFIDPGVTGEQDYQALKLMGGKNSNSAFTIEAFVPLSQLKASGNEIRRFELGSSNDAYVSNEAIAGVPFELIAFQGNKATSFDFGSSSTLPPAMVKIRYTEADIAGYSEGDLNLYRWAGVRWELVSCGSSGVQRLINQNTLFVPICQTGEYVISDSLPLSQFPGNNRVYLPFISK